MCEESDWPPVDDDMMMIIIRTHIIISFGFGQLSIHKSSRAEEVYEEGIKIV